MRRLCQSNVQTRSKEWARCSAAQSLQYDPELHESTRNRSSGSLQPTRSPSLTLVPPRSLDFRAARTPLVWNSNIKSATVIVVSTEKKKRCT
jgi:hypothetical protein